MAQLANSIGRVEAVSRSRPLVRAACAGLIAKATHTVHRDVLRQHFANAADVALQLKAATTPASSLSDADWAAVLVANAVPEFLGTLGGAASGLQKRGLHFTFDNAGAIAVTNLMTDGTAAGFVQQMDPIPVRQFSTADGNLLKPRKLASISVFTRETFNHSLPNIELMTRTVLSENIDLALDAAMLDTAAASDARPAGLRNSIAAAGVASANPVKLEAMKEDLAVLLGAVAAVAGNNEVVIVASPVQAMALKLWMGSVLGFPVLASSALTAGTVIAVASNALISAVDPAATFEISDQAVLHMDTAPSQITTTGTPIVMAAPLISLFQADSVALKCSIGVAWGLRNAGGLAWLENVGW